MSMVQKLSAKMALIGALAIALTVGAAVSANALPISLKSAELVGLAHVSFTGPAAPVSTLNLGGGNYSTEWNTAVDGSAVTQTNGITTAARGGAGDSFDLIVKNNNGSLWNFMVSINNGAQTSDPISLLNGSSYRFSFGLLAALTQVSVTVGQKLPIGTARSATYVLSDDDDEDEGRRVTDPGSTMGLLALGLVGMAGIRRKLRS